MRFLLLFCWLASCVMAQKSSLIDFNSPFVKTAILQNQLGQEEIREILSAEKRDNLLELKKADGTLVVVPLDKVVAIVPKLPSPDMRYTQDQASQALLLLRKAQPTIAKREEVSALALSNWERLARHESHFESEEKKMRAAIIQNWFAKVTLEGDEEKNISLEEYVREGEQFLNQAGDERPVVEARLEKARQRLAMDFAKVDKIQLVPEWDNITPLAPIGILGILAFITVWGLLNISNFLTALKMTLMSFISTERTSRVIILNTKSLMGLVLGPLLLYLVFQATRIEKISSQNETPLWLTPTEKRAVYLSLNSHFNWSRQAAQEIKVPAERMLRFLYSRIENTNPHAGHVQYGTPEYRFEPYGLILLQNLKVLMVPFQLKFSLMFGDGAFSLSRTKTKQIWLGRLPLGSLVGDYFAEELFSAFQAWNDQVGIDSKALWIWNGKDQLVISTPEVFSHKTEGQVLGKNAGGKKIVVPKSLSSNELAQVFSTGEGDAYLGKYIDVFGSIEEVSSAHRLGNNLAGETIRKTVMQSGGPEAVAKLAAKGMEDTPDNFFLSTKGSPAASKIRVKCVVKAPEVFFLDTHGDLYKEGQNPANSDPLVRKGEVAHFNGGRIESFERGVIEIYDAKLIESGTQTNP